MKNLKKITKLVSISFLIVLATLGIGIAGGIPISTNTKREEKQKPKMEIVELKEDKAKLNTIKQ